MLHTTQGIVLKTFKYQESGIIAKIYTEKLGLQSYLIHGVRQTKSQTQQALLQPLSLLNMVVYHRANQQIHHTKELKFAYTFHSIPFQVIKSAFCLLISEILYKVLKEETPNYPQFNFIYHYIQYLDQTESSIANLHIYFLLQLSIYLGFRPETNFIAEKTPYFDIKGGGFTTQRPSHVYYLEAPLHALIPKFLSISISDVHSIALSKSQRKELLDALIFYYTWHIDGFSNLQSLKIIEEVFS